MSTRTGALTVQHWLGATHPRLADACDRSQGLASVFGDIVEGVRVHAEVFGCHPADYRPVTTVEEDGTVVLDLAPVASEGQSGDVYATRQAIAAHGQDIAALAFICEQVPGLDDVLAEVAKVFEAHAAVNHASIEDYKPEAFVMPDGRIVVSLNPPSRA